jgi:hypothetical protein
VADACVIFLLGDFKSSNSNVMRLCNRPKKALAFSTTPLYFSLHHLLLWVTEPVAELLNQIQNGSISDRL